MAALTDDMKDVTYKVVILGDAAVGKTALTMRYVLSTFDPTVAATIGLHYLTKKVTWQGKELLLNIYDVAGQEAFNRAMTPLVRRHADAIISCYDITQKKSLSNAQRWIDDCAENDDTLLVLVGCKSDLENNRIISTKEGLQMATDLNIRHFEVSAKHNTNTEEVFTYVVSNLANRMSKANTSDKNDSIVLHQNEAPKRNRCC